jgi:hypothetical protein
MDHRGGGCAPALDRLSCEHLALLDLCVELQRLAHLDAHDAAVAVLDLEFLPLLETHAAKEDRGVFAQLRLASRDLLSHCTSARLQVTTLADMIRRGDDGWRLAVAQLTESLADQVALEEVALFPAARRRLTAAQWHRVELAHDVLERRAPTSHG